MEDAQLHIQVLPLWEIPETVGDGHLSLSLFSVCQVSSQWAERWHKWQGPVFQNPSEQFMPVVWKSYWHPEERRGASRLETRPCFTPKAMLPPVAAMTGTQKGKESAVQIWCLFQMSLLVIWFRRRKLIMMEDQ